MIVRCTECNAAYQVDDAKVENKRFAFTCPKCKAHVIIDNRKVVEQAPVREEMQELEAYAESFRKPATHSVTTIEDEIKHDDLFKDDILSHDAATIIEEEESGEIKDKQRAKHYHTEEFEPIEHDIDQFSFDTELKEQSSEDFGDLLTDKIVTDEIITDEVDETLTPRKEKSLDFDDFTTEELKSITEEASFDKQQFDDSILYEDIKTDEIFSKEKDVDESLTIDLDSLDISLEETPEIVKGESEEIPDLDELRLQEDVGPIDESIADISSTHEAEAEFDDIKLDLDSLDIELEEDNEILSGEQILEEDEKLTLDDAGLTIDELIHEEVKSEDEEELKLSLDEIEPGLTVDDLHKELTETEIASFISNETQLPEVDLDKFEAEGALEEEKVESVPQEVEEVSDSIPKGYINVTVDYTLSYSRWGALARLTGLYFITLIPHFLTSIVYSIVSFVVGFFNWLVVLFTGQFIDDFADIQQNTLRYMMSIFACATQVIEDRPIFAGRSRVDHSLQLDVVYPSYPSRVLAVLRISIIGILIVALPHIILLIVLTAGMVLLALIGLICIIAIKRWPTLVFDFMYRYIRYSSRVIAYIVGLVDRYPTFIF